MIQQPGAARSRARQPLGALGYGIFIFVSGFAVIWLTWSVIAIVAAWRKQKRRNKRR